MASNLTFIPLPIRDISQFEVSRVQRSHGLLPVERDDLESYAYLGYLEARHRYQPARGAFPQFARQWIRGSLLQGLRSHSLLSRRAAEHLQRQRARHPHVNTRQLYNHHLREVSLAMTGLGPYPADLQYDLALQRRRLATALGKLRAEHREALEAIYDLKETGDTGVALAKRLGVSRGTISRRHQAALGRLRVLLRGAQLSGDQFSGDPSSRPGDAGDR